jgi:hypothetical protein
MIIWRMAWRAVRGARHAAWCGAWRAGQGRAGIIGLILLKYLWPFGGGIFCATPPAPESSRNGSRSAPGLGPPYKSHSQ